jgi:hypothetical protein
LEYDHGTAVGGSAASRDANGDRISSSAPSMPENSNSRRRGIGARFANRSRTVARSPHSDARSSGTYAATESSSESAPASTRRAIAVATMDFVSDPIAKRVAGDTDSRVVTSTTP